MRIIAVAMRRIEDNTCIRFKPRANERNYIQIENRGGCSAIVGRAEGRGFVSLHNSNKGTCFTNGIVTHELMHVIGLQHEHSRYDRDNFVKVHPENIKEGELINNHSNANFKYYRLGQWSRFEKVNPDEFTTYGVPYDYKSIMHYRKGAFARSGKIAIETLDPRYQVQPEEWQSEDVPSFQVRGTSGKKWECQLT
ncbi:astacin [Necator americanus]|uniref:Metalloendopeptidase n=1 Tax=Necator americanus TaxID=51031 RepID=W2T797_NECAM|nr:astacin [Necator americanus]ETN76862.1 astacin [Necator americanus]